VIQEKAPFGTTKEVAKKVGKADPSATNLTLTTGHDFCRFSAIFYA
jgi:hypothetical protein